MAFFYRDDVSIAKCTASPIARRLCRPPQPWALLFTDINWIFGGLSVNAGQRRSFFSVYTGTHFGQRLFYLCPAFGRFHEKPLFEFPSLFAQANEGWGTRDSCERSDLCTYFPQHLVNAWTTRCIDQKKQLLQSSLIAFQFLDTFDCSLRHDLTFFLLGSYQPLMASAK